MKTNLAFAILMIGTTVAAAQDRMAENLRKGVVEEESKHNLNAAIQDYQAVLSQFDEARQTAATALFRMAESYRKQGKDDQAMAAYKRVAQEFADQGKLAEQSRSILGGKYLSTPTESPSDIAQVKVRDQARQMYRSTLVDEVSLIQKKLADVQARARIGDAGPSDVDAVRIELLQAQRQLAAFDADFGMPATVKK
jgi:hypothetical protein